MFTADAGATKFIGYLLRYTPDGKLKMQARQANPNTPMGPVPPEWTEVKKPGPGPWVPGQALFGGAPVQGQGPSYGDIVTVTGPGNKPAFPVGAE
jgi:hypothetical protein